jgi:hypothetical protein
LAHNKGPRPSTSLYPGLTGCHKQQRAFVKRHEFVRSPLGRVRHLPTIASSDWSVRSKAERQSINSPLQSTLADMMEWAIALVDAEFPNEEVQVVGNIHDAIFGYIDEYKVESLLQQVMAIMSNLPLHQVGWKQPLKFTVDAEAGQNLAEVKKWNPRRRGALPPQMPQLGKERPLRKRPANAQDRPLNAQDRPEARVPGLDPVRAEAPESCRKRYWEEAAGVAVR